MSVWDQVLVSLGGSALLLGAVAWLVKTLISQFISKDLAAYRSQLEAANARGIEQLRNDLKISAVEREIRLRISQETVAKVVGTTYERLSATWDTLIFYAPGLKLKGAADTSEGCLDAFNKAYGALVEWFRPN